MTQQISWGRWKASPHRELTCRLATAGVALALTVGPLAGAGAAADGAPAPAPASPRAQAVAEWKAGAGR